MNLQLVKAFVSGGAALTLLALAGCAGQNPPGSEAAAPATDSYFAPHPVEAPAKVLPDRPLVCDLQARPSYGRGERVEVAFRLTNRGQKPLWVLRWNTPLEGLIGDCFEIRHGDEVIFYLGRMVKRAMPEASEYVLIPPGESREGRIDLRAAYAVEQPGTYSLEFDSVLFDVTDDESQLPRKIEDHESFDPKCPSVVFEVR